MTFEWNEFFRAVEKTFLQMLGAMHDAVFPARETERLTRRMDMPRLRALFAPTITHIGTDANQISIPSLFPYRLPEVQSLILEAKFHKNSHAYSLLGLMVARYVGTQLIPQAAQGTANNYIKVCPKIVLVPIPLGAARRKERGYNQVEEVAKVAQAVLSRKYSSISGVSVTLEPSLLVRRRETVPQMTLGRAERLQNMSGAFVVNPLNAKTLDPSIQYVLLDDVLTTGATLLAAHEALRVAGAEFIFPVSLAH